jgi:CubicO group peptidase (beta-lactamase class C family)
MKSLTIHSHLLTHASGISYDQMDPLLNQWRTARGEKPGMRGMPMIERIQVPLLFEPGTSWAYGLGIDWAGLLVARLNNVTLEEYMQKNLWDPLGIENITFHNDLKPNVKKNLVKLSVRQGIDDPFLMLASDTGKPVIWEDKLIYDDPLPLGDDYGGNGGIGSATEFFKILSSILLNDSKLLKPASVELMFTPQLSSGSKVALTAFFEAPYFQGTFASHPAGSNVDYGLAGLVTLDDEDTGRCKGTLTWSGAPNLLWTIDRGAGLITFYATNIMPFGDHRTYKYQQMFEREMYLRSRQ